MMRFCRSTKIRSNSPYPSCEANSPWSAAGVSENPRASRRPDRLHFLPMLFVAEDIRKKGIQGCAWVLGDADLNYFSLDYISAIKGMTGRAGQLDSQSQGLQKHRPDDRFNEDSNIGSPGGRLQHEKSGFERQAFLRGALSSPQPDTEIVAEQSQSMHPSCLESSKRRSQKSEKIQSECLPKSATQVQQAEKRLGLNLVYSAM
jgi:hypothetical protein